MSHRTHKQLLTALLRIVADEFQVPAAKLKAHDRHGSLLVPRFTFYKVARIVLDIGPNDIGRFLGGRDHGAVCHGIKALTGLYPTHLRQIDRVNRRATDLLKGRCLYCHGQAAKDSLCCGECICDR